MKPAYTIVAETLAARTHCAGAAYVRRGANCARTHVPAATIVAAWMSAEAGVGPSIASVSQSWNGICADLPSTPMTSAVSPKVTTGDGARSWQ